MLLISSREALQLAQKTALSTLVATSLARVLLPTLWRRLRRERPAGARPAEPDVETNSRDVAGSELNWREDMIRDAVRSTSRRKGYFDDVV